MPLDCWWYATTSLAISCSPGPALAVLKKATPAPHVSVLVPAYTAPVAQLCPWVDEVIIDPGEQAPKDAQRALLATLRKGGFTAMLTLYSTTRIGWLGLRSGIPLRMAPATKWAQLFYNRRVTQRRSRSAKPEYRYNLELAEAMIQALELSPGQPPAPTLLAPGPAGRRRAAAYPEPDTGRSTRHAPGCFSIQAAAALRST